MGTNGIPNQKNTDTHISTLCVPLKNPLSFVVFYTNSYLRQLQTGHKISAFYLDICLNSFAGRYFGRSVRCYWAKGVVAGNLEAAQQSFLAASKWLERWRSQGMKCSGLDGSGGVIFYTLINPTTPSIATIKPTTPRRPRYFSSPLRYLKYEKNAKKQKKNSCQGLCKTKAWKPRNPRNPKKPFIQSLSFVCFLFRFIVYHSLFLIFSNHHEGRFPITCYIRTHHLYGNFPMALARIS